MQFAIGAVAIVPLIIGLVEYAKRFGLKGNGCNALAGALGFFFVGLTEAMNQGLIPEPVLPWVVVVVTGLGGTLTAVGLYDFSKRFIK